MIRVMLLMIIMIMMLKILLEQWQFFLCKLFCKTSRNHERTCAKKKRKRAIDEQRVLLSVCKFTRIPFGLFSRLQSPYISCSLAHCMVFSLVFHFVVVVIWIQIGKPIIYTSNFGRRWFSYINTYIVEVCIGSKSLKVGMSKHINSVVAECE